MAGKALRHVTLCSSELTEAHRLIQRFEQVVLHHAFCGELVAKPPNEEPLPEVAAHDGAARARKARSTRSKKQRFTTPEGTMKRTTANSLRQALDSVTGDRVSFEELRALCSGTYDELKDALFAVLGETPPTLVQEFDSALNAMRFRKISQ